MRSYDANPALRYAVLPGAAGRYEWIVHVRAYGNRSQYEASTRTSVLVGQTCSSAELEASVSSNDPRTVTLAATSRCTYPNAEYRFLARPPGATAFSELRAWDASALASLAAPPGADGRYDFQVQVRFAGNASDWEATDTATSFVGRSCWSASLIAVPDGAAGVRLSGSAACQEGGTPEYRFMIRRPGASAFAALRDWSSEPRLSFVADPGPGASGRYEFRVDARAVGNASDLEASATTSRLLGSTCPQLRLTQTPRDPSSVDLAAEPIGAGVGVEFRFFVRGPDEATFHDVTGWTGYANYTLRPLAPGRYEVRVDARAYGNASDYEARGTTTVFVGRSCPEATLAVTPQSYGAADLLAAATCVLGGQPEYRFLVRRPGEVAFAELQPWSPSPSAHSYPVGFADYGSYEFQVQVRSVGNRGFDASARSVSLLGDVCSTVALSATGEPGDYGFQLRAAAACTGFASPEYRFMLLRPGATAFTELRGWSTDPIAPFAPQYAEHGRFEFMVYARARGNASASEGSAKLAKLAGWGCSFTTLRASTEGMVQYLLASASCTAYPEYRFFVRKPGETAYLELTDWQGEPYFAYQATVPGPYAYRVWVRGRTNASAWEAHADTEALTQNTCAATGLTATVGQEDPATFAVTLDATASCTGDWWTSPAYRFMVRRPGAAEFTELQAYGSTPSALLYVTAAEAGAYEFRVDVRSQYSPWDTEGSSVAVATVGSACTFAGLTATYDGSGAVDLQASSACTAGATGEYRFLVRRPGTSTYTEVRPFGSAATFHAAVDPKLTGVYAYRVDVRAKGNTSAAETSATATAAVGQSCASVAVTTARTTWSVDLQASPTCTAGAVPELRFLAKEPGAAAYTELRTYGPVDVLSFALPSNVSGAWVFRADARAEGNATDLRRDCGDNHPRRRFVLERHALRPARRGPGVRPALFGRDLHGGRHAAVPVPRAGAGRGVVHAAPRRIPVRRLLLVAAPALRARAVRVRGPGARRGQRLDVRGAGNRDHRHRRLTALAGNGDLTAGRPPSPRAARPHGHASTVRKYAVPDFSGVTWCTIRWPFSTVSRDWVLRAARATSIVTVSPRRSWSVTADVLAAGERHELRLPLLELEPLLLDLLPPDVGERRQLALLILEARVDRRRPLARPLDDADAHGDLRLGEGGDRREGGDGEQGGDHPASHLPLRASRRHVPTSSCRSTTGPSAVWRTVVASPSDESSSIATGPGPPSSRTYTMTARAARTGTSPAAAAARWRRSQPSTPVRSP